MPNVKVGLDWDALHMRSVNPKPKSEKPTVSSKGFAAVALLGIFHI